MAATDKDVRRKLQAEREGLAEAVDALRSELGETKKRGARIVATAGGALGLLTAARAARRLRRRA